MFTKNLKYNLTPPDMYNGSSQASVLYQIRRKNPLVYQGLKSTLVGAQNNERSHALVQNVPSFA